jgi:hypothetical protein
LNANRYIPAAESIAQAIPALLTEQGLDPFISRFVLTETEQGEAWLFVIMDHRVLEYLECYTKPTVLAHLSAALHGHTVVSSSSRSDGLHYAVLLSPSKNISQTKPCLPVYHLRQTL